MYCFSKMLPYLSYFNPRTSGSWASTGWGLDHCLAAVLAYLQHIRVKLPPIWYAYTLIMCFNLHNVICGAYARQGKFQKSMRS